MSRDFVAIRTLCKKGPPENFFFRFEFGDGTNIIIYCRIHLEIFKRIIFWFAAAHYNLPWKTMKNKFAPIRLAFFVPHKGRMLNPERWAHFKLIRIRIKDKKRREHMVVFSHIFWRIIFFFRLDSTKQCGRILVRRLIIFLSAKYSPKCPFDQPIHTYETYNHPPIYTWSFLTW